MASEQSSVISGRRRVELPRSEEPQPEAGDEETRLGGGDGPVGWTNGKLRSSLGGGKVPAPSEVRLLLTRNYFYFSET